MTARFPAPAPLASGDRAAAAQQWHDSGAAALSGPPPGGALGPPERLVEGVAGLTERIEAAADRLGSTVVVDGMHLLTERARLRGLRAGGRTSCGGATRLLACADGWVAVAVARDSDVDIVPAWLALAGAPGHLSSEHVAWDRIDGAVAELEGHRLAAAAELVGLPVGVLGERPMTADHGVDVIDLGAAPPDRGTPPLVVDLSSLWAGPLCGALLGDAGAQVVKVESAGRPDGARIGDAALHRRLNGSKAHEVVDPTTASGRRRLRDVLLGADVVVESARPRGLEQMGIVARELLDGPDGPQVWVSITGHGRRSRRVAFGDDAAVAGGLVVSDAAGPWFCVDAVADPLSGLAGAAAALECLADRRRAMVDVAMAGVAAAYAGPTMPPDPSNSAPAT